VPIYEYRCDECGVSFEILQKMSDDPLETCAECGGALRKVLHPVAIHFKGSGFYTTDYGKGSGRPSGSRDASSDGGESGGSSSTSESKSGADDKVVTGAKPDGPAKDGGKPKEKQQTT
jgi:putative FmdB family regulatory protein